MHPNKILIIQTAFIGDVILITPLIRAVGQLFPSALIDVLVIPQSSAVLENNPHVRHILLFDKRKNKLTAFFKTLRQIRKNKYDLAISPHSSLTSAYLMLLGGIKARLGFDRWHASKYLTMKVPHKKGIHKIRKNLHLLSVFGENQYDMQTELFPASDTIKKYAALPEQMPYSGRPVIAIAPGSIWNTKRWPVTYYSELTKTLERERFNLIFIGSPDEEVLCRRIINDAQSRAINFAGKSTIPESAAIINQCDLLICNDSGAMHIANAMQTDVFVFFGPTVKFIGYYPFREKDRVFELDLNCRPCGKHGGDACPLGHFKCMLNIKPQTVMKAIREKFATETESA